MVQVADILKGRHVGAEVELRGWIHRIRVVGGKVFVVVRDSTGVVQATVTKGAIPEDEFAAVEKALIESSVVVRGAVAADTRAPGGYEVRVSSVRVVHYAEKFPIQEDLSEEFLLDVRHLWIRSQRMAAIFCVRHTVFDAVHEAVETGAIDARLLEVGPDPAPQRPRLSYVEDLPALALEEVHPRGPRKILELLSQINAHRGSILLCGRRVSAQLGR